MKLKAGFNVLYKKNMANAGRNAIFYVWEVIMKKVNFSDVLDAAESLAIDEREELVALLHKRSTEERRKELAKEIKSARADLKNGRVTTISADALMKEILS